MILNPWQGTFNQLGLAKHWWHRLCVVTFFIALVLMLGASWFLAFTSLKPVNSSMPEIEYWQNGSDGNLYRVIRSSPVTQAQYDAEVKRLKNDKSEYNTPLPVGSFTISPLADLPSSVYFDDSPLVEQISMPDGTRSEFSGKTWKTDAELKRDWNKALHKALFKAWTLSITIAIGLTLALSYLLQSLYRVLLYVVYGSAERKAARR